MSEFSVSFLPQLRQAVWNRDSTLWMKFVNEFVWICCRELIGLFQARPRRDQALTLCQTDIRAKTEANLSLLCCLDVGELKEQMSEVPKCKIWYLPPPTVTTCNSFFEVWPLWTDNRCSYSAVLRSVYHVPITVHVGFKLLHTFVSDF